MKKFFLDTNGWYFFISLTCLLAIFLIPYISPFKEPMAQTMSYDYGFNNKIAILLIFISIIIWMGLGFCSKTNKIDYVINRSKTEENLSKFSKTLYFSILFYSLWMLLLLLFVGDEVGEIRESKYFLQYYYRLEIGKQGYVDFAYGYGPLTLYPPYWLHKFSGLSIPVSYAIILYLFHVLGILCTYDVIKSLNLNEIEKKCFFLAIFFSMLFYAAGGGLHYQLLRFALPSWFINKIAGLYYTLPNDSKGIKYLNCLLIIPITILIVLLISPEIALAYGMACFLYLLLLFFLKKKIVYLVTITLELILLISIYYFFPELFAYTMAFSGGYFNLPFTFNIILVVFIFAIFVISFNLGALCKNCINNLRSIAFTIVSFSLLPACFGRCDAGHLLWNGLFILLLAYIVIKKHITRRYLVMGFICILYLTPVYFLVDLYCIEFTRGVLQNNLVFFSKKKEHFPHCVKHVIEKKEKNTPKYPVDLSKIDKIAMPFANFNLLIQLTKDDKLVDLYFSNIYNRIAINRNIKDIEEKEIPFLLLPQKWQIKPSEQEKIEDYQYLVNKILLAWYPFEKKNDGYKAYAPLISYIRSHYYLDKVGGGYELWCRK